MEVLEKTARFDLIQSATKLSRIGLTNQDILEVNIFTVLELSKYSSMIQKKVTNFASALCRPSNMATLGHSCMTSEVNWQKSEKPSRIEESIGGTAGDDLLKVKQTKISRGDRLTEDSGSRHIHGTRTV